MVLISSLVLLAEHPATWELMSLEAGATVVVCSALAVGTATFLSVTASSGARNIARTMGVTAAVLVMITAAAWWLLRPEPEKLY